MTSFETRGMSKICANKGTSERDWREGVMDCVAKGGLMIGRDFRAG